MLTATYCLAVHGECDRIPADRRAEVDIEQHLSRLIVEGAEVTNRVADKD